MSKYKDNKVNEDLPNSWSTIIDLVEPQSKVLDVGCSSGYLAEKLNEAKSTQVWGVDIDPDDITTAQKYCVKAVVADVETEEWITHFQKNFFDVAILADILEHLKDPFSLLVKLRNLLKKDGNLIVSVPNIAHMSVRLSIMNGNFPHQQAGIMDNTHLKYFTRESIIDLIESAGFEIKELRPILINQIPKKVINDELEEIGLKASDNFEKILNSEEANAYQYIVSAQIGSSYPKKITYPEKFKIQINADNYINKVNRLVRERDDEIKEYDRNLKIVIKKLQILEKERYKFEERGREIQKIKKNYFYRLLHFFRLM